MADGIWLVSAMVNGKYKYLKMFCNKILQHPQFTACCTDDFCYILKLIGYSSKPDFLILYIYTFEHFSLKHDDRNSISHSDEFLIYCWNRFVGDMILWSLKS